MVQWRHLGRTLYMYIKSIFKIKCITTYLPKFIFLSNSKHLSIFLSLSYSGVGTKYGRCSKILNTSCCQKDLDKQHRPWSDCFFRSSLIRVCAVCYSDKYFVIFNPDNHHSIWASMRENLSSGVCKQQRRRPARTRAVDRWASGDPIRSAIHSG